MTGFRPATRSEAKPLIGLYSESGCGKTWSALLLARGFVGEGGTIGMIETEGGRGEAYVGRAPVGSYLVRPIGRPPAPPQLFSPQEYGKAIGEAEQAKLDALIIDSASHEWEGAGGVLAMAAANQAAGKKGVLVWQQPKIDHQRHFMLRLMQTAIPLVIVCMRAKYPMEQKPGAGDGGWVRSKDLDPKQADDILFEMFVHGWIDKDHKFHGTKYTVPELADVIRDNQPIGVDSGHRLAQWACGAAFTPSVAAGPSAPLDGPARGAGEAVTQAASPDASPSLFRQHIEDLKARGVDASEIMAVCDGHLGEAAKFGMEALKAAWAEIPGGCREALKAALDRRHKPVALESDKQKETA